MRILLITLALTGCNQIGGDNEAPDAGTGNGCMASAEPPPPCGEIETLSDEIVIDECKDFDTLPKGCWRLDSALVIKGNAITSVARLGGLQEVSALGLEDTGLTSFDTAHSVEVTDALVITDNEDLTTFDTIELGDELAGLEVTSNPALTELVIGSDVTGDVVIKKNRRLTRLELGAITVGSLTISDNQLLTEINLPALSSVGSEAFAGLRVGDLAIERVPALATLGLPSLRSVGGSFRIADTGLASLAGVGGNIDVGWDLVISNNESLGDLGDVSRAQHVEHAIEITGNLLVGTCQVRAVGCCVRASTVIAEGNQAGPTCNEEPWCSTTSWWDEFWGVDGCPK